MFSASAVSGVLSIVVLSSARPWAPELAPVSVAKALSVARSAEVVEPLSTGSGRKTLSATLAVDALVVEHLLDSSWARA